MDLNDLTLDELEQEMNKLVAAGSDLKVQRVEVQKLIDKRIAEEKARRVVEYMDDTERAALVQQLQTIGVPSAENIGNGGVR